MTVATERTTPTARDIAALGQLLTGAAHYQQASGGTEILDTKNRDRIAGVVEAFCAQFLEPDDGS